VPEPTTASSQYEAVVERLDELSRLCSQAQRRKSMLVFGPEGVGKTRLLHQFVAVQPRAVYMNQIATPRELLLCLLEELRRLQRGTQIPATLSSRSTPSLRGIAQRVLDQYPFILVFDQLAGPSRVCTGIIKELNYYDRTPIIFAARSPHMEDIGTLQPMCADRSERVEMRNFPTAVAGEFAQKRAEETKLTGSNLAVALHSIVDWSQGNPGSIIRMIEMARLPKYRMEDQIKVHVLYLDHLMGRHPLR